MGGMLLVLSSEVSESGRRIRFGERYGMKDGIIDHYENTGFYSPR